LKSFFHNWTLTSWLPMGQLFLNASKETKLRCVGWYRNELFSNIQFLFSHPVTFGSVIKYDHSTSANIWTEKSYHWHFDGYIVWEPAKVYSYNWVQKVWLWKLNTCIKMMKDLCFLMPKIIFDQTFEYRFNFCRNLI
jgi:hypothetical protein